MSIEPAQSKAPESVATRRNVIRDAAWTTAAVTVVVAVPDLAGGGSWLSPS